MKIKPLLIYFIIAAACFLSRDAYGAKFPSVIDAGNPYNAGMLRILGDDAEDRIGFSTAAGDINGDGREDMILGAYTADGGRGVTYVYFGSATIFDTGVKDLSASLSGTLSIIGKNFLDWSGYSVAVGNIDGDAYDDVIIGAYKADPGGRINTGETYVIFGSASIHTRGTIDLSGTPSGVVRIYGNNTEDNSGFSVAAGFVNEDAYEDLIIGAYRADPKGRADAGETYLIFGSADFQGKGVIDLSGAPAGVARIYGETAGEYSGYSVAAGDMNGDSEEDVVIGAYMRFDGKGCTYVLPGSADIDTSTVIDLSDLPSGMIRAFGEDDNDYSGKAVTTGDLNGDGYHDLIMGAPGGDPAGRYDAGEINVVFGGATFQNKGAFFMNDLHVDKLTIYGKDPGIPIGTSLATGKINGDGSSELIIGYPGGSPPGRNAAGMTYVLYGALNLKLTTLIDINDSPPEVSTVYGINPGDNSGQAVGAGDIDGDGFKDLIIGAHFANPGSRNNAGEVYVIKGFGTTEVISFSPPHLSYVSRYRDITMFFNSEMSSLTVDVESQSGVVNGTLDWSLDSATFTPTNPLPPGNRVDVTISGKNVDDEAMAVKTWHFFVKQNETPAKMLTHFPEANEVNVAPDEDVVITFTNDIYPDSTTVLLTGYNGRTITLTKSWADSVLTLVNNNAFQLNETVTVALSASDQYGDRSDSTWTFTVRPEAVPPDFTVQVTGGNLQHVPRNAQIHLYFPLDIDKSSVEKTLEGSISGIISGSWTWADTIFVFVPTQFYQPGEYLVLTVNASDIHRNTVSKTVTLPIRPDDIPPSIVSRSPVDGEANVALNANIVVVLSTDSVRDSTTVSVVSRKQGVKSHTKSWLDYTLTLSGMSFVLGDTLDVTISAGDEYANRQDYTWTFYVKEDITPPYFTVVSPVNPDLTHPDENISLVFPSDIDKLKVTTILKGSLNEDMPGVWAWSDSVYTFTPSSPYPLGYQLMLTVNATDIHNNPIPQTTHVFKVKPDEIPPKVKTHTPPAYAVNVPVGSFIVINFSSDVYKSTTSVTVSSDKRSSISMNQAWTDSTLTLSPQASFQQDETVTVSVSMNDVHANHSEYVWRFSTGSDLVLSLYDVIVPGRVDMMGTFDPITLVFNDIIDKSTVSAVLTGNVSGSVNGSWAWAAQNYTFTPSQGYSLGESLTVTVNALDISQNPIPVSSRSFLVKPDEEPPQITGRSPAPQAVEIAPYHDIVIEFTGDVLSDSTHVTVTGRGGRTIQMAQSWEGSTITLINDKSFILAEIVTVSVNAGDYYGNRMQDSWSFTIKVTEIPPLILFHSPSRNEINVHPDRNIMLQFTGNVDSDFTTVTVSGSIQGTISMTQSWADSVLTLINNNSFNLDETITVSVRAGNSWGNYTDDSWMFSVKPDVDPPYYQLIVLENNDIIPNSADFSFAFPADIDTVSVDISLTGSVTGTVSSKRMWSDSVYNITPISYLVSGETITLKVNASDIYDNVLPETVHVYTVASTNFPWLTISGVTLYNSQTSTYRIDYIFGDSDGDYTTTLGWQYKVDNGEWVDINTSEISGNDPHAPGSRKVFWTLPNTLKGVYSENVRIRMQVTDGKYISEYHESPSFKVNWNNVPTVRITGAVADYLKNRSIITYVVTDQERDTVSLLFEYSLDGGHTWNVGTPGDDLSSLTSDKYSGFFFWEFTQGLEPGTDYTDVRVRLIPSDYKTGASFISEPYRIDLNAPPSVSIDAIESPQSEDVTIFYRLAENEKDTVRFVCYYSLNSGLEWVKTTHVTGADAITTDKGSIIWHSRMDIPVNNSATVKFRIEPWDSDKGTDDFTEDFTLVNNGFPGISVDIPDSTGNVVTIPYLIDDPEKDPVTLHVMWSSDGLEWLPATVIGDILDITYDKYGGTLAWTSVVDAGTGFFENIHIRISVSDEQNPVETPGLNFAGASFVLDNEAPSLMEAVGFADGDTVYCSFSEPVIPASLLDKENYVLSHNLTIQSVISGTGYDRVMLVLEDGQFLPFETLTLTATNLMDVYENIAGELNSDFLPGNFNSPPSVTVSLPDTVGNNVSIPFTIGDFEKNPVTLHVIWSFDHQSWHPATVLGDTLNISAENYLNTLSWLSAGDTGAGFFENVSLRITATDRLNPPGEEDLKYAEVSISLDNEAPLLTAVAGYAESDTVYFSFNEPVGQTAVFDVNNYALSNNLSVKSILAAGGQQHYALTLDDGHILPLDQVQLTITDVEDVFGNTVERSYAFTPYDINISPDISINPMPAVGTGDIVIEYAVTDFEGNTVNLAVSYSADGGNTWNDAAVTGNVTGIALENYQGSIVWNSSDDLPGIHNENVMIRLTASDRHEGKPAVSNIFTVDNNEPPSVELSIADPDSIYYETFTVSYVLSDAENDILSIQAYFSKDGGVTYLPATVSGAVAEISADRYSGTLQWDSKTDFPGEYETLLFQIVPSDISPGFAGSLPILVDNTGLSRVIITVPEGEQYAEIPVEYHVYDNRKVDITLLSTYSADGGIIWKDATIDKDLSGLSPGRYIGSFQWLAQNDLDGYEGTVLFMSFPVNDRNGITDTKEVNVDYNDPPVLTADQIEDEVSGDVAVFYVAADTEADKVNITVLYSLDNRLTWAEAESGGDYENVIADGSSRSLLWHSANDLPGSDIDVVWLQMTAADYDSSEIVEIGPFHLDNNALSSIELAIENPDSTYVDFVVISYDLTDAENDTLKVQPSYSTDGGVSYLPATVTGNTTDIVQSGYSSGVGWLIADDLPDYYGDVLFRLMPSDNDEGTPDSLTVAINSYGFCSVSAAVTDIQDSTVVINFVISDPKEHVVTLGVDYSLDNGASWNTAETFGQLTDISPALYSGLFVWKSRMDSEGFDGIALLRITPNNGVDGTPSIQEIEVDYNEPPTVEFLTVFEDTDYSGPISMTVKASDVESDPVNVVVEYSLDGGITYHRATLADSSALTPGVNAVLSWLTLNDLGFVRNLVVMLRVIPEDNDPGEPVAGGTLTVTNIVGDYNFDYVIDGDDLPGFIDAWNQQDLFREIGPATGIVPDLIVHPDGVVDFEDLAVFTMMWNWYTELARPDSIPRFKAVAENFGDDIRLERLDPTTIAILCDSRPDYMSLSVEAGFGREAVMTVDEGSYWTTDNNGFVLTRYPGKSRFEFASGIFHGGASTDRGPFTLASIHFNEKLSENDIIEVTYKLREAGDTEIVEGTVQHTVDRLPISPDGFTLMQNSPNPFNPSTTISFENPQDTHLTLSIYTVEGQLVTVLVNDIMKAGSHSFIWNAENMPSGIYLFTVKTGRYSETKKMMLLK